MGAPDRTFAFVGGLSCTAVDFARAFCIVIAIAFNTLTSILMQMNKKNTCKCLKNVSTLPQSHMHILNVSITTVQSLKVSLDV
jgi:hypothetical protein